MNRFKAMNIGIKVCRGARRNDGDHPSKPAPRGVLRTDWAATLLIGWHAMRQHRRMRRELAALSRKAPRLLRDMGLEPERIYELLDGTSDEVGPAHLSRLLRSQITP